MPTQTKKCGSGHFFGSERIEDGGFLYSEKQEDKRNGEAERPGGADKQGGEQAHFDGITAEKENYQGSDGHTDKINGSYGVPVGRHRKNLLQQRMTRIIVTGRI
ncbi:hypothetical protein [Enterobacillus tribolii]|uniref:hypothetical protein n=1 Tax=Enterobacillus tribolii TaxID=1487935 RepID=UPI00406A6CED